MSIQPLRDFVIVTKEESQKTTASGLYLAGTSDEKIVTGTVLAVGTGAVLSTGAIMKMEVKVGDKVAFNKNMAAEMKDGTDTVLLLREDQLLCIVK